MPECKQVSKGHEDKKKGNKNPGLTLNRVYARRAVLDETIERLEREKARLTPPTPRTSEASRSTTAVATVAAEVQALRAELDAVRSAAHGAPRAGEPQPTPPAAIAAMRNELVELRAALQQRGGRAGADAAALDTQVRINLRLHARLAADARAAAPPPPAAPPAEWPRVALALAPAAPSERVRAYDEVSVGAAPSRSI